MKTSAVVAGDTLEMIREAARIETVQTSIDIRQSCLQHFDTVKRS